MLHRRDVRDGRGWRGRDWGDATFSLNTTSAFHCLLRANHVNKGLAQNYVDGAFMGRGKYYRLICGDNSEPKETIVTVLKAIGEADIIIPYYLSNEGKGFRRELISKCYTALINLITGNKIHYYNGLHVHLRHNVMRWHSNTRGFGFQADLPCLLLDLDFSYREITGGDRGATRGSVKCADVPQPSFRRSLA